MAGKNKYHHTRYFFHPGREPSVWLDHGGNIYQGILRACWRGGVQIILARFSLCDPPAVQGVGNSTQPATARLTLGEPGQGRVLHDWVLAEVRNFVKSGKISVTLEAPDAEASQVLDAHLRDLKGGYHVSKGLAADRLPGSTVKTHYSRQAVQQRRDWAEQLTGASLANLSQALFEPESLAGNIENYIGAVQIPVGIAGPVLVRGDYTDGYVPVPIATTEGALVRSISRGAKVLARAGGVEVAVRKQGMIRAPVFFCDSMRGALNLERWILGHLQEIRHKAEQTSSVAVLRELKIHVFDNTLHLLFCYSTGDASGQNMTSSCTWNACEWIREQIHDYEGIGFQKYYIEGNMSGDKKLSHLNLSGERGVSVLATCYIPDELLLRYLRVDGRMLAEYVQAAEVSSLNLGIVGQNGNIANVIAGIFTATGQDIACVHESSTGIFKVRYDGRGLHCNMNLPGLIIGTVGGGTRLATQRECLEMMDCHGSGKLFRFAEIIAATCLALDISTSAAIVSNDFVRAHDSLGRNRPHTGLTAAELNVHFLNSLLPASEPPLLEAQEIPMLANDGILNDLGLDARRSRMTGLHRFQVRREAGAPCPPTLMLKLKGTDDELIATGIKLAMLAGDNRLAGLFAAQSEIFNIEDSHVRELMLYREAPPPLRAVLPHCHGVQIDTRRKIYALLMEDLSNCDLLDSVNQPERWQAQQIETVLAKLAQLHAHFTVAAIPKSWRVRSFDPAMNLRCVELLRELTQVNRENHRWFDRGGLPDEINAFLDKIEGNSAIMQAGLQTLTHNDCNPRNLCLSLEGELKLYDWELALVQNPQRDLIEFLAYVFPAEGDADLFFHYSEYYRQQLEAALSYPVVRSEFEFLLRLNALWFAATRLNLYAMGHSLLRFDYLERVCANLARMVTQFMPATPELTASMAGSAT